MYAHKLFSCWSLLQWVITGAHFRIWHFIGHHIYLSLYGILHRISSFVHEVPLVWDQLVTFVSRGPIDRCMDPCDIGSMCWRSTIYCARQSPNAGIAINLIHTSLRTQTPTLLTNPELSPPLTTWSSATWDRAGPTKAQWPG